MQLEAETHYECLYYNGSVCARVCGSLCVLGCQSGVREHNLCTRGRFILYTPLYGNSCNFLMQFTCALKCSVCLHVRVYVCVIVSVYIFYIFFFETLPDFWFNHMPLLRVLPAKAHKICQLQVSLRACQCVSYMWYTTKWNRLSCIPKPRFDLLPLRAETCTRLFRSSFREFELWGFRLVFIWQKCLHIFYLNQLTKTLAIRSMAGSQKIQT